MNEQQVLQSVGRSGWFVIGRTNVTKKVSGLDADRNPITTEQPTDQWVWTISDGQGHNDQMTVSVGTGGDNKGGTGYDIVTPPSKAPPAAAAAKGGPLTDYVGIGADGQPVQPGQQPVIMYNPKTGDKIDLPAVKAGGGAQLVNAGNGAMYAWDGTTLTPLTQANPDKPQTISQSDGSIYSFDGTTLTQIKAPNPPKANTAVVGNKVVNTDSGAVLYDGGTNLTLEKRDDGSIWGIDPTGQRPAQQILAPNAKPTPPALVPGQNTNQPNLLQQDPTTGALTAVPNPIAGQQPPTTVSGQAGPTILQQMPDGSYKSVPNPAYVSKQEQALNDLNAGINQIQQMLASGQIDVPTANTYKTALQKNYETALQGTTPYQLQKDQQDRQAAQQSLSASLLNQRVASGTSMANSLLSSAMGIVGNKNFMDPSALAGFAPFSNAAQYVTDLGGGSDVYNAAANALKSGLGPDPATALLSSALAPPGTQPAAANTTRPLLPPGMAGTPADTGMGPIPPGAYPTITGPQAAAQQSAANTMALATGNSDNLRNLLLQAATAGLGAQP